MSQYHTLPAPKIHVLRTSLILVEYEPGNQTSEDIGHRAVAEIRSQGWPAALVPKASTVVVAATTEHDNSTPWTDPNWPATSLSQEDRRTLEQAADRPAS